jgi:hypothetical protein
MNSSSGHTFKFKVLNTDKLIDKTVVIERELEKEFYKLYNEALLMFKFEYSEMCSEIIIVLNPDTNKSF